MMHLFDRFAGAATRQAGSPAAFALAVAVVLIWAISGPLFGFSETWQLVINTGTTIITFLMVFLIQQSQNKDSTAVHLKLNELLASHKEASNHLISIEDLDEEELRQLVRFYRHLAELADQEGGVKCSHSLDEAQEIHEDKSRALHERLRRTRMQRGHETAQG
nr:low affinity iron permease family protein [Cupriavidus plantarum]